MGLHFISYARQDGRQFAEQLKDELLRGKPPIQTWLAGQDMVYGHSWRRQVVEAILTCETVLFVLTDDAATSPHCEFELEVAYAKQRPIIPLRVSEGVDMPAILITLPSVSFTTLDRIAGVQDLRDRLMKIDSPAGRIQDLNERLRFKQHELHRAHSEERSIIQSEIDDLRQRIEEERAVVNGSPVTAQLDAPSSRRPVKTADGSLRVRERPSPVYVNVDPLPPELPWSPEFRNREEQLHQLDRHLRDDGTRLVIVTGPEGFGKTRVVCQMVQELASGQRAGGPDAVVYLSGDGARPVTAPLMLAELRKALPDDADPSLGDLLEQPDLIPLHKLDALLAGLADAGRRAILIVDAVDELLDRTRRFRQPELHAMLARLMRGRGPVKVVLLSRELPEPRLPGTTGIVTLEAGLPPKDARSLLRDLGLERLLGVVGESTALLDRACEVTDGHPRALEAIYGNLRLPGTRRTSLRKLLDAAAAAAPNMLDFLVDDMFANLDPFPRRVVQVLAVFARPVGLDAIRSVLQLSDRDQPIESALRWLLEARLIRRDGDRYFLPSPDSARVFRRIPEERGDRKSPFSRQALLHRAAAYCAGISAAIEVRQMEDLEPHMMEIDLLIRAAEYGRALALMNEIDRRYLSRWGYSQVLGEQREILKDNLSEDGPRLVNLNALGRIHELRNELGEAADCYRDALALAQGQNWTTIQMKLNINLASAELASGRMHEAHKHHQTALSLAREHGDQAEEAAALLGLAQYHVRAGAFSPALQHARQALRIAREQELGDLMPDLLLNIGRWRAQLGQTMAARLCFDEGLKLSGGQEQRLEAKFLDAMAELLIDQGRLARAVPLAQQAVRIGWLAGDSTILREAGFTLALGLLCTGACQEAWDAIDVACRYGAGDQWPSALALQGVIALQLEGHDWNADQAFRTVLGLVRGRRAGAAPDSEQDFALLDAEGIALCGLLVLQDEEYELIDAVRAFRQARTVTRAPGIVGRVLRLLGELEAARPSVALVEALRAAAAEPEATPPDVLLEQGNKKTRTQT